MERVHVGIVVLVTAILNTTIWACLISDPTVKALPDKALSGIGTQRSRNEALRMKSAEFSRGERYQGDREVLGDLDFKVNGIGQRIICQS